MRNPKKITLVLTLDGKNVREWTLEKGCSPVEIGRASACCCCTPSDERSISNRHARVFWKGPNLFIEDLGSRNGVCCGDAKVVKATKVDIRKTYRIGRGQLTFQALDPRQAKKKTHWQLYCLNGERYREVIPLRPAEDRTEFTIGSDAGNDLVLKDKAVSRRHARIVIKPDRTYWICDLSSRNGSKVNEEMLPAERERLLRDGDKISLAYYDFQFHDPDWRAPASVWSKFLAAVITLLLLVAGYQFYTMTMVPQPVQYIRWAEQAASQERFADAFVYAQKAAELATGPDKVAVENLQRALEQQKATYEWWREAIGFLKKNDLESARRNLFQLVGDGSKANWGWNTATNGSARGAYASAAFCKQFFDLLGDPKEELARVGADAGARRTIEARVAEIDAYLRAQAPLLPTYPYLTKAVDRLKRHRAELLGILSGIAAVDQALAEVTCNTNTLEVSDFAPVVQKLLQVAEDGKLPAGVRTRAKTLLPASRQFVIAQKFLQDEKAKICDMDFEGVHALKDKLPVPGSEACACHPTLSAVRATLQRSHENYQKEVSLIAPMVRNLDSLGIRNGEKGHVITFVTDEAAWRKALAFDCFTARFPLASRVDPTSMYDELIGIEYTYENLRELPKPLGRKNAVLMNFVPKCQNAKGAFTQVKTFQKMMARAESQEFRAGKLGALSALGAQILAARDALVAFLRKTAEAPAGQDRDRGKIVAGYYAEYFVDEPSYADLRALEAAFQKLQKKVNRLNEAYDAENDPEKRLQIKKAILATGIPGMEAVRRVWVNVE